MDRVLITGATGNVGLAALRLLDSGVYPDVEIVAAVRDIDRARSVEGINHCTFRHLEFDEPVTYTRALEGISKIVLIRPNQVSDVSKYIFPFLSKAEKMGVRHIVFISIIGAERNRMFANHRMENHFKKLSVPSTILRSSLYMQNFTTLHRHDIQVHDRINIPGGIGLVNFIDVRDIAEVIAEVLMHPGHENQAYELTGPESLDFYDIAKIFTKELGRDIKYTRPSVIKFVRQKLIDKKQALMVVTLSTLYNAVRVGKMNYKTDAVLQLAGHPPRSLSNFIREYKEYWTKGMNI